MKELIGFITEDIGKFIIKLVIYVSIFSIVVFGCKLITTPKSITYYEEEATVVDKYGTINHSFQYGWRYGVG